ncbi:hypothetical protein B0H13DRAFT_2472063 [Mycena leptocephala]|nr:hypothetical protein B0H13DRAFT_2472063 [Mycena leptocephala]
MHSARQPSPGFPTGRATELIAVFEAAPVRASTPTHSCAVSSPAPGFFTPAQSVASDSYAQEFHSTFVLDPCRRPRARVTSPPTTTHSAPAHASVDEHAVSQPPISSGRTSPSGTDTFTPSGTYRSRIRRRELLHIRLLLKHTLRRLPALRLLTPNPIRTTAHTPLPPSAARAGQPALAASKRTQYRRAVERAGAGGSPKDSSSSSSSTSSKSAEKKSVEKKSGKSKSSDEHPSTARSRSRNPPRASSTAGGVPARTASIRTILSIESASSAASNGSDRSNGSRSTVFTNLKHVRQTTPIGRRFHEHACIPSHYLAGFQVQVAFFKLLDDPPDGLCLVSRSAQLGPFCEHVCTSPRSHTTFIAWSASVTLAADSWLQYLG